MNKFDRQCIEFVFANGYNQVKVEKEIVVMAQKSANLYIRIEPEVKAQAESILSALGISASSAINLFYKQIILQKGIPFDIKLPENTPLDLNTLSDTDLSRELEIGYQNMLEGKTKPAEEVFANIRKDYGV